MPDAALRRLADRGQLRNPAVLEREVRRMLQDDKARTLVNEFGGQWLQVRALESAAPDKERFPGFDDYLRFSMRQETELFFASIIREDRSIFDFLTAPYTFVNERLARHYGIDGVAGPEFRRIEVPAAAGRHPDACQRAHRVFLRHPHLARAARQMDPGEPARRPAA